MDADKSEWSYKTSTEISENLSTLTNKLTPQKVGKALKAIGYSKDNENLHSRIIRGLPTYNIPPKKFLYL